MEKLITIRTLSELRALKQYLEDKDFLAFDTETVGVTRGSEIIGYSVCAELDTAYYVVLSYWDVATQKLVYLETKDETKDFFQSLKGKNLIAHNAVFDCDMINVGFGVDLMPNVFCDTMIAAHLLDENRRCGLKELAVSIYGEDSNKEQREMKDSVTRNGGVLTKALYELYKADSELIARYGAKDTILTLKLFYHFHEQLVEQGLDKFFYDDESMPLLRGPTYQLNTTGIRVDPERLQNLKGTLEVEIAEAEAFIRSEIAPNLSDKYPGTSKANTFNIGAGQQLSWLIFDKMKEDFHLLTDVGKEICKFLNLKLPYGPKERRAFIQGVKESQGIVYRKAGSISPSTGKTLKTDAKIGEYWKYLSTGKITMGLLAPRYKWIQKLIEYNKNKKLLSTYVLPIMTKSADDCNIIRPSFLQHGTTSGRYSSRNPNFQNLPKEDKRVKACIIARPGKVFVGADHSQLEPRVFASTSQDPALMSCFEKGEDFYSVVGAPIFEINDCSMIKNDPNSFANKYPKLRDKAKVVGLSTPYGRTANQMASEMKTSREEAQALIDAYFNKYHSVEAMMLESHEIVKRDGVVYNLFGRPRRIPEAKKIMKNVPHSELPYVDRTLLNLAMNHRVQSTGASLMNREAIWICNAIKDLAEQEPLWKEVNIILQVHDQLVLEGPKELEEEMKAIVKMGMEDAVQLPGVKLEAIPFASDDLAGQK